MRSNATRRKAARGLLTLLLLLSPRGLAAQAPSSWVRSHSATERTLARLAEATSSSERVYWVERLSRMGPAERVASGLSTALAAELEPAVRSALWRAALRLAALDPEAARAFAPLAIQRFGEASAATERAPWAQLLGSIASEEAIAALMSRRDEEAVQDALLRARATDALLAALDEPDRAQLVALLGRIGDRRAVEPLFGRLGAEGDLSTLDALSRIAAASADEALTERVREAVVRALRGSEDARRLIQLFDALARLGPMDSRPEALASHLADPEPAVAEAALRCAHALDPGWAAEFALTLPIDDRRIPPLLEQSDEPRLVPLAAALGALDAALDFLARARDGAGIDALIALDASPLVIAVALRRWGTAGHEVPRSWGAAHRALAGGPVSFEMMLEGDRAARLSGAIGLALAAERPRGPLAEWVRSEPDRGVRAWLLEAVRRHRVALDAHWLRRALLDEAEPAAILVVPFATGSASDRRTLRQTLSRLLRLGTPAQIAAAAWSLSVMGAVEASAALEALLEDPHPAVRIAAGRALLALRPDRTAPLRARAAIDPDPRVARLLSATPIEERDILFLDVTVMGAQVSAPWIEVQGDDGLLRQLPVGANGTFALLDVQGALAEVRLILGE